MRTNRVCACVVGMALLLGPAAPDSVSYAMMLGTAFTYQGQLKNDEGPVEGQCDFRFTLWDAAMGGNQVGPEQTLSAVDVTNGLFAVQLDFGQDAFNGKARWLEIAVNGTRITSLPRWPKARMSRSPRPRHSPTAATRMCS